MVKLGVISNYAVFGAIAQMRYTEAVATLDADILVALPDENRLDLLKPIYLSDKWTQFKKRFLDV